MSTTFDDLFNDQDDDLDTSEIAPSTEVVTEESQAAQSQPQPSPSAQSSLVSLSQHSQVQRQTSSSHAPSHGIFGNGALGAPEHFLVPEITYPEQPPAATQSSHHGFDFTLFAIPRIVGSDPLPYDPQTYNRELVLQSLAPYQREYTRGVETMIRWRWKTLPDGTKTRESNSRIVVWDDGSSHLQVGRQYFPLVVKNGEFLPAISQSSQQQQQQSKEPKLIFIRCNDLFFHIGQITADASAHVHKSSLTQYGPRMEAVFKKLAAENNENRLRGLRGETVTQYGGPMQPYAAISSQAYVARLEAAQQQQQEEQQRLAVEQAKQAQAAKAAAAAAAAAASSAARLANAQPAPAPVSAAQAPAPEPVQPQAVPVPVVAPASAPFQNAISPPIGPSASPALHMNGSPTIQEPVSAIPIQIPPQLNQQQPGLEQFSPVGFNSGSNFGLAVSPPAAPLSPPVVPFATHEPVGFMPLPSSQQPNTPVVAPFAPNLDDMTNL